MNRSGIILVLLAIAIVFAPSRHVIAQLDETAVPAAADSSEVTNQSDYGTSGPNLFPPPAANCSTSGPVFIQPSGPMIGPSPPLEVVPLVPVPDCNSPRPAPLPGPIFTAPPTGAAPALAAPEASPLSGIAPGGMVSPQFGLPLGTDALPGLANPILVPVVDDELAWEQIADVVSDYFTIAREQQARRSGEVWTEGRIETAYQGGATWLEPHRHDSVGSFNRWESTFQTIRRIATVRVIPDPGGYLVEVVVQKELEDLPRPEHATAGAATFLTDNAIPSQRVAAVSHTFSSPRWLPVGRDPALEARMLADIHARLAGVTSGPLSSIVP
jgi:hypothetical protein